MSSIESAVPAIQDIPLYIYLSTSCRSTHVISTQLKSHRLLCFLSSQYEMCDILTKALINTHNFVLHAYLVAFILREVFKHIKQPATVGKQHYINRTYRTYIIILCCHLRVVYVIAMNTQCLNKQKF